MLKHYVKYGFSAIIASDYKTQEIKSRDITQLDIPPKSFGFRFYDVEEISLDNEILRGTPKNYSGWHYFGEKLTIDDVRRKYGPSILLSNMEVNEWDVVVKTRAGTVYPLYENDVVLETIKP